MRALGVVFASLFATTSAFAAEDVDTLAKQLDEEHASLSTQDCVVACKALGSIRRASEKICELEPGPRCADARAKADDAQRRVQAACPDCQVAAARPKDEERRATKHGAPQDSPVSVSPPAAERGRGGCASCNTPGEPPSGDLAIMMLAALAIARRLRTRARRS